jgi:hypothetical protein
MPIMIQRELPIKAKRLIIVGKYLTKDKSSPIDTIEEIGLSSSYIIKGSEILYNPNIIKITPNIVTPIVLLRIIILPLFRTIIHNFYHKRLGLFISFFIAAIKITAFFSL